jgi:hypothetical protein
MLDQKKYPKRSDTLGSLFLNTEFTTLSYF